MSGQWERRLLQTAFFLTAVFLRVDSRINVIGVERHQAGRISLFVQAYLALINTPLKQGVNEISINTVVSDLYSPAQKLRCARIRPLPAKSACCFRPGL
jgi:hypothetical protein